MQTNSQVEHLNIPIVITTLQNIVFCTGTSLHYSYHIVKRNGIINITVNICQTHMKFTDCEDLEGEAKYFDISVREKVSGNKFENRGPIADFRHYSYHIVKRNGIINITVNICQTDKHSECKIFTFYRTENITDEKRE